MTDRTVGLLEYLADVTDAPWEEASDFFSGVPKAQPTAADYAISVRKLYDDLQVTGHNPDILRECLLLLVSEQLDHGVISEQHSELVDKLLAKSAAPPRKRGRPRDARGKTASKKRYDLLQHWIRENCADPSLTKEEFAKKHLGITKAELDPEVDVDPDDPDADGPLRRKLAALLQDLKPARMKGLNVDQRTGLETIYRLLLTRPQDLARRWQEKKRRTPALIKEDFFREFFRLPLDSMRHPIDANLLAVYLETLDRGEKVLASSERGG